jgi:hypothetical protein
MGAKAIIPSGDAAAMKEAAGGLAEQTMLQRCGSSPSSPNAGDKIEAESTAAAAAAAAVVVTAAPVRPN